MIPRRRALLPVAAAVVALLALGAVLLREGPDRTVTGRVTSAEPHRLCITDGPERPRCFDADAPQLIAAARRGACVEVGYNAERVLQSVRPATSCRSE